MKRFALLLCLVSSVVFASGQGHTTTVVPFVANVSAIRTDLGISTNPAIVQNMIQVGAYSLTNTWGSGTFFQYDGNSSQVTCTAGTNLLTADNVTCTGGCAPASITYCNSNQNWVITLHKKFATTWGIGSTSSTEADLMGGVEWGFGLIALAGHHPAGSTCLMQASPSVTALAQYRDAPCLEEQQDLYTYGVGTQGDDIFYMLSNAGWPTPSGSQWSGETSEFQTGISVADLGRGWTNDGGTEQRVDSLFKTNVYWLAPDDPLRFCDLGMGLSYCDDITSQTVDGGTDRRPAIAYDSKRQTWVLAATQDNGPTDRVYFWSSTDQINWTLLSYVNGTVIFREFGNTSPAETYIYTRKPMSFFYDAHQDQFVLAYVNADPNAGALVANTNGLWNEVVVAQDPAAWFYSDLSFLAAEGDGVISWGGPAIICNDVNADVCPTGTSSTNPSCVVVYDAATTSSDLEAWDFYANYWPGPCDGNANGYASYGFLSGSAPYRVASLQDLVMFTPSLAFAHLNSTNSRGILATSTASSGDTSVLTMSNLTMPATGGTSTSSWGAYYFPNDPWDGGATQRSPYGGPVIRASADDSDFLILLQSNTGTPP